MTNQKMYSPFLKLKERIASLEQPGRAKTAKRLLEEIPEEIGMEFDLTLLRLHLQTAIELEFSTLPPYLTALYSITDNSSYAYDLIRSVALEEMLHFNLACNLLLAFGGSPKITDSHCPQYPAVLPHQNTNGPIGELVIQLMPLSTDLLQNVFMAIEEPAPEEAAPQINNYDTIGQFYKAIELQIEKLHKKYGDKIFDHKTSSYQKDQYYFGSGGGNAIIVTDLSSAKLAIKTIADQGEGSVKLDQPLAPMQQFGNFDNYGYRTDGTYGPRVGSTEDESHYFKFRDLATGVYPVPKAYPMVANPKVEKFSNVYAQKFGDLFNGCYSVMMCSLELSFNSEDLQPDPFMTVGFSIMQVIIPMLSVQLMAIPADDIPLGQTTYGPVAGPSFEWKQTRLSTVLAEAEALSKELTTQLQKDPGNPNEASAISALAGTASAVAGTLSDIMSKAKTLAI